MATQTFGFELLTLVRPVVGFRVHWEDCITKVDNIVLGSEQPANEPNQSWLFMLQPDEQVTMIQCCTTPTHEISAIRIATNIRSSRWIGDPTRGTLDTLTAARGAKIHAICGIFTARAVVNVGMIQAPTAVRLPPPHLGFSDVVLFSTPGADDKRRFRSSEVDARAFVVCCDGPRVVSIDVVSADGQRRYMAAANKRVVSPGQHVFMLEPTERVVAVEYTLESPGTLQALRLKTTFRLSPWFGTRDVRKNIESMSCEDGATSFICGFFSESGGNRIRRLGAVVASLK